MRWPRPELDCPAAQIEIETERERERERESGKKLLQYVGCSELPEAWICHVFLSFTLE